MIHLLDTSTTMGKSMEPCRDLKSAIMVSTSQEFHLEPFQMDKKISFCAHLKREVFGYSEQAIFCGNIKTWYSHYITEKQTLWGLATAQ